MSRADRSSESDHLIGDDAAAAAAAAADDDDDQEESPGRPPSQARGSIARLLSYLDPMSALEAANGSSTFASTAKTKRSSHYGISGWLSARPKREAKKLKYPRQSQVVGPNQQSDMQSNQNQAPGCRPKLALILVTVLLMSSSVVLLLKSAPHLPHPTLADSDYSDEPNPDEPQTDSDAWLVAGRKCKIPRFEPWDASISDYVHLKPQVDCQAALKEAGYTQRPVSLVRDNRLYLSAEALAASSCCYRQISRPADNDDELEYADSCVKITRNGLAAPASFVKVECKSLNYTNVHAFVVHDQEEEEALGRVARLKLRPARHFNVVVLGVDTMSSLNAQRQLSRTLEVLRARYQTLHFPGYNKVGENTFPNLVPLLTGLTPRQLVETGCWAVKNYTDSDSGDDFLDNCKFLWNYYQQLGYSTYFGEDWPKASTFNYLKQGFRREPTAYYNRPFTLARDSLLYPPVSMGCSDCQLHRPAVEVDLEHLKTFIELHRQRPHFAFHWINCPQHDDLNGASRFDHITEKFFNDIHELTYESRTFVVFLSDHGYRWNDFIKTRIGHYESALPLLTIAAPRAFIEEHPAEYANLMAHRSALLTPFDMFKTLISIRNLGLSKGRLARRAAVQRADDSTAGPTASTTIWLDRLLDGLTYEQRFSSLSLLERHSRAELDRSCFEAGIPDNYCVCNQFRRLSLKEPMDSLVLGAAYYLVYAHMDSKLEQHQDKCRLLDLKSVKSAELLDFGQMKAASEENLKIGQRFGRPSKHSNVTSRQTNLDEVASHLMPDREYNLQVLTSPGDGLFQEVVRFNGDINACRARAELTREIIEDPSSSFGKRLRSVRSMNRKCQFSVHSESASRLNLYSKQSACVKSDIELKKICYCNDLD